jgi:hypothetical protein
MRSAFAVLALLAACHQNPSPAVNRQTMSDVYAQLDAKCGEDPNTLARLIDREAGTAELSAELFAVVVNNSLEAGTYRESCASVIGSLSRSIVRQA